MLEIIDLTIDHFDEIVDDLRDGVLAEFGDRDARKYVEQYLLGGLGYAVVDGGKPLAIGGTYPTGKGVGEVWTLATDGVRKHGLWYTKTCKKRILADMDELGLNMVEATVSKGFEEGGRWINLLGFTEIGEKGEQRYFALPKESKGLDLSAAKTMTLGNLASEMKKMPQAETSVEHNFSDGVYMRTMHIPAGTLVVGKKHKTKFMNVMLKGRLSLLMNGEIYDMTAPMIMESDRDVQKVGFAYEDTVWTTIHATNKKDVDSAMDELVYPESELDDDPQIGNFLSMLDHRLEKLARLEA